MAGAATGVLISLFKLCLSWVIGCSAEIYSFARGGIPKAIAELKGAIKFSWV